MDGTTANDIAKVFLKADHRTENKFAGKIEKWWNNQPDALRRTLLSIFQVAHAMFNYHQIIYDELKLVAERTYMIACSIPDRPLANNTYFWTEVLEQVNDVFLGASNEQTTSQQIAADLRTLPNFTTKETAYYKLTSMKREAFERREARTASQLTVYAKDSDTSQTPSTILRTSPRRQDGLRERPRAATAVSRSSSFSKDVSPDNMGSADLLVQTRPHGRIHPRDDGSPDCVPLTQPYSRHPGPDHRRDRDRSRERDISEDRTRDNHSMDRDRDRSLGRW
jgi:hypothetical protein